MGGGGSGRQPPTHGRGNPEGTPKIGMFVVKFNFKKIRLSGKHIEADPNPKEITDSKQKAGHKAQTVGLRQCGAPEGRETAGGTEERVEARPTHRALDLWPEGAGSLS